VKALGAAGHEVRALARRPDAPELAGIESCAGDLTDRASLDRAVRGVDAVVHLAALLHITDPPPDMRTTYHRVNVDSTRWLAEAAERAGVRRFVLASTTAVYGPVATPATESTPPAPDSWYAESKLAAEAAVFAAHRPGDFDVCVLRLSAVYGPRIKGNYQRLLLALAARRFVPLGRGANRRSLIYEDDAAAAFVTALEHPRAPGRLYNVSDGTPHSLREIVRAMCAALGRAEPAISLPARPTIVGVRTLERLARLVGITPPVTASTLAKYLEDSVVDSTRLTRELGFTARVDLDAGWLGTVQALRASGVLPMGAR
jgi:UDP-glucose 4-epimerase